FQVGVAELSLLIDLHEKADVSAQEFEVLGALVEAALQVLQALRKRAVDGLLVQAADLAGHAHALQAVVRLFLEDHVVRGLGALRLAAAGKQTSQSHQCPRAQRSGLRQLRHFARSFSSKVTAAQPPRASGSPPNLKNSTRPARRAPELQP